MLKPKLLVYVVGFTAALAGLLFGVDVGVIAGALPFVSAEFHLSSSLQGFVVSAVLIGAFLGTLVSGYICRHYGRRFALQLSGLIFSVGAILSVVSVSAEMLISVRIFLGLALGIASFSAPLYLSELAPKSVRGGLIALYQLMITLGIFAAFVCDLVLTPSGNWRWMLGVPLVPAVIMFVTALFLPRSPRWLMLWKRDEEAKQVLHRVRHAEEVLPEMEEIAQTVDTVQRPLDAFKIRGFNKLLLLGMVLQLLQQFSGINTVMYYAPTIFKLAGFTSHIEQIWWTVAVGLVNCLTTIIAVLIIDKLGRRPVLFFGAAVITISMFFLGLAFHLGVDTPFLKYLAVASVLTFIFGFAVSLGPVIWILCAEIFPLQGRDIGITFSTATNWACNALIGFTFLIVLEWLKPANTFWMFSIIGVITLLIFYWFVPETKQVSLEHIEARLMAGKRLRELGQ